MGVVDLRTNLRQAGEIEKSSRWTIARLIAASVEPGRAGDNQHGGVAPGRHLKLGMREASRVMGRSDNTIRAYLNAWNAAADDGLCAPSTDLTPADGWTASSQCASNRSNARSNQELTKTIPPPIVCRVGIFVDTEARSSDRAFFTPTRATLACPT